MPVILAEPPRTRFDVRFRLVGVPVRIHPMFWVVAAALGLRLPPLEHVVWVGVVFVSILIHEMGHALAFGFFRRPSRVVLYSLGGLTLPEGRAGGTWSGWRPGLVALSGPVAGLGLATTAWILLPWMGSTADGALGAIYYHVIWINLVWGALNMLPVWPLDGGQVARSLLVHWIPENGYAVSVTLSLVTAIVMAIVSWQIGFPLATLLFGYFALTEWQRSF